MEQVSLNGIYTYPFSNYTGLLEFIENKKKLLIAVNAEKILSKNKKLASIINTNIGYPDGFGAVWLLRKKGFHAKKIPGVELWLKIIQKYCNTKSFYFIGSSSKVITLTVFKLKKEFPDIDIRNYRDGYFNSDEETFLIKDLLKTKPDIVFVAIGSPKQEYIMERLYDKYPALYMGLGGSFDVYTGLKKRAPSFLINLHLEWLYRLLKEPHRITRQIKLLKILKLIYLEDHK